MRRRYGDSEEYILGVQSNLALTYLRLGRTEQALNMERDVYFGRLKLFGEEHYDTLLAANNYAASLLDLRRFEEAQTLLLNAMPVARRKLGAEHRLMLSIRWTYAEALYKDPSAALDNLRKAVTTLEETERIARRVLGGAHPIAVDIEGALRNARAVLRARETLQS